MNARSDPASRTLPAAILSRTDVRLFLAVAVGALGALLALYWAGEFFAVLRDGVAGSAITVDFQTYRCGVQDMARPYGTCGNGEAVSGFVYPPPSLIYFKALSLLPLDRSFMVHALVGLAAVSGALWLLVRFSGFPRRAALAAALACAGIAPVATSFAAGQVNHIVMALCVAAVCASASGRHARAGVAVALGFWLKLYPAFVPALFLTARRWPGAAWTVVATLGIAVVALLWAAPALYLDYFLRLLPHVQGYTMPGIGHSIAGIAAHAAHGGGNPVGHFEAVPQAVQVVSKVALALGVVLAMAHQHLTGGRVALLSLGVLLAGALVSAPNSWGYHYALIVPLLFPLLASELDRPTWRCVVVLPCWLALCVPDWTAPPTLVAEVPALNVLFFGRYALVAVLLAALAFTRLGMDRSASTSPS